VFQSGDANVYSLHLLLIVLFHVPPKIYVSVGAQREGRRCLHGHLWAAVLHSQSIDIKGLNTNKWR
jgi:hypothetical protein